MSKILVVISDNIHLKPKRDSLALITDKASGGSGTAEPRALSSLVSSSYGSSLTSLSLSPPLPLTPPLPPSLLFRRDGGVLRKALCPSLFQAHVSYFLVR